MEPDPAALALAIRASFGREMILSVLADFDDAAGGCPGVVGGCRSTFINSCRFHAPAYLLGCPDWLEGELAVLHALVAMEALRNEP